MEHSGQGKAGGGFYVFHIIFYIFPKSRLGVGDKALVEGENPGSLTLNGIPVY